MWTMNYVANVHDSIGNVHDFLVVFFTVSMNFGPLDTQRWTNLSALFPLLSRKTRDGPATVDTRRASDDLIAVKTFSLLPSPTRTRFSCVALFVNNSRRKRFLSIHPANENGLKWIQIFRNTNLWMLKWTIFNLESFLFLYRNCIKHISMSFNLKIILAFSVQSWILFRIVNGKYSFFNSVKFKNNISNFCATWICSIQYSEYEIQIFNLIE